MQSAVPFLSQRHITCPYPHSSTHSLPCHLLSPRSYPRNASFPPPFLLRLTTCPRCPLLPELPTMARPPLDPPCALTLVLTLEGAGAAGESDKGQETRKGRAKRSYHQRTLTAPFQPPI